MEENRTNIGEQNRVSLVMIAEGLFVGVLAGLTVILYRVCLSYATKWLDKVLQFLYKNPAWFAGWFAVLLLLAVVVGRLLRWEPLIAGGGIPQVEAEIAGTLSRRWMRVIPAKFAGGFLCVFGGMSL